MKLNIKYCITNKGFIVVKWIKHDIGLTKLSICREGDTPYIFAKAWTFKGYLILLTRGYKRHKTIFGNVMMKEITRIT